MMDSLIDRSKSWIDSSKKIVAFTGAGISTRSGVPDLDMIDLILRKEEFRGGVFRMLDPNYAVNNPDSFYELYEKTFRNTSAKPNAAHRYLKQLEDKGKLTGVVTMNIDYLHQLAGSKNVAELWGDVKSSTCTRCHKSYIQPVDAKPLKTCDICGGVVLPDFVLRYLATYPNQVSIGNAMLQSADLLLIIGTKRSPNSFDNGVKKIVINDQAISKQTGDIIYLRGDAGEVLEQLLS